MQTLNEGLRRIADENKVVPDPVGELLASKLALLPPRPVAAPLGTDDSRAQDIMQLLQGEKVFTTALNAEPALVLPAARPRSSTTRPRRSSKPFPR